MAAGVGGFVIEDGPCDAVGELAADIRRRSESPPIIAIAPATLAASAWGDTPLAIPPAAAVASLRESIALRRVARAVARETRRAGCNALLAPSCDVPRVPTVDAFGRDASEVALAAAEWIDAAQAEGVLCIAGRFPGAGAVAQTESGAPTVRDSDDALYARDLVPFRAAIDAGVAGLLVAHVAYAALDASGVPAALSRIILERLLRTQLEFDGLAVADAALVGVPAAGRASAADLVAAGIDLVIRPLNVDVELRALMDAVQARALDPERVHQAARRRRLRAEMAGAPVAAPNATGDEVWLAETAERTVVVVRGRNVRLAVPIELAVAGASADRSSAIADAFAAGIGEAGGERSHVRRVRAPTPAVRTPLVVFVPPHPTDSGADAGGDRQAAALCAEAHRLGRETVVVWCGHPATELAMAGAALVLACWSPSEAMARAVGRWLLRRV
jgi:beta-glucosidase-like glycosyl hydrolase